MMLAAVVFLDAASDHDIKKGASAFIATAKTAHNTDQHALRPRSPQADPKHEVGDRRSQQESGGNEGASSRNGDAAHADASSSNVLR